MKRILNWYGEVEPYVTPFLALWLAFAVSEILDIKYMTKYESVNGTYELMYTSDWFAFPYVVTCIALICLAIIRGVNYAIKKLTEKNGH